MKQLFQALSRTSDGAFIIDEQHQIVYWNQAAQSLLGYTADETINHSCYEILGGRDALGRLLCRHYCHLKIGALQGDTMPNMDMYALTKDGEGRWINMTTFAIPTGEGELGHMFVHLFRDAMKKKSHEHFVGEVVKATKELQNGNGQFSSITNPEIPPDPGYDALTPREREVLLLLARGMGTGEMAEILSISQATIRNHIQSIIGKLRVHSRLEAVAYAYQQGLIDLNDQLDEP